MTELSVVIPAFNEEQRLPRTLQSVQAYLSDTENEDGVEVIVVDDGSADQTSRCVRQMQADWRGLRLIRHPVNQGKGAAIRSGCRAARGEWILLYDADGAVPIAAEAELRQLLRTRPWLAMVVGVRYGNDGLIVMSRRRRWLGSLFSSLASRVVGRPCRDTQCGFKMFRAAMVLPHVLALHERRFSFDVELLARIVRAGLVFSEREIPWEQQPGSKVSMWRDGTAMLTSLIAIWWRVRRRPAAARSVGESLSAATEPAAAQPGRSG